MNEYNRMSYMNDDIVQTGYVFPKKITKDVFEKEEKRWGREFPDSLKAFYLQKNYLHMTYQTQEFENQARKASYMFLPPNVIVSFMQGKLKETFGGETFCMMSSAYECLEKGEMPFFEISDCSAFLTMKLDSDTPEAVWRSGAKIADTFEEFIYYTYYEGPESIQTIEDVSKIKKLKREWEKNTGKKWGKTTLEKMNTTGIVETIEVDLPFHSTIPILSSREWLKKNWEEMLGEGVKWPKEQIQKLNAEGVLKTLEVDCQIHYIIPKQFGGVDEGLNIIPLSRMEALDMYGAEKSPKISWIKNFEKKFQINFKNNQNMYPYIKNKDSFYCVKERDILNLEKQIGYTLPEAFKKFYLEVGFGKFVFEDPNLQKKNASSSNFFLPPDVIEYFTNFVHLFLEGEFDEYITYISHKNFHMISSYFNFEKGEVPFFEVYDSCVFLTMKLESDTPQAIWRVNTKIADTFEEFIKRLYHEGPEFLLYPDAPNIAESGSDLTEENLEEEKPLENTKDKSGVYR